MYKVLHVVGCMRRGGAETMIMNYYRNIDRSKIQFDFLTTVEGDHDYNNEILSMGGRIIVIKPPKKGVIRYIISVINTIKKYGPYDAVHAHTLFNCGLVLFAARIAGVRKRISHSHSTDRDKNRPLWRIYQYIMRKLIILNATKMLACGEKAGAYLYGSRGVNSQKFMLLPNAINIDEFVTNEKSYAFRKEYGISEKTILIVNVARFSLVKNHIFMLNIADSLKHRITNFKLIFVGDGELREKIYTKAQELGLSEYIIFAGIRSDIPNVLNSMDIFILPSLREGVPISLIEAQAAGLKCLVSERVTTEADLGLGLVTFLPVNDNADFWAESIINVAKNRIILSADSIRDRVIKCGYSIKDNISLIEKLYCS